MSGSPEVVSRMKRKGVMMMERESEDIEKILSRLNVFDSGPL